MIEPPPAFPPPSSPHRAASHLCRIFPSFPNRSGFISSLCLQCPLCPPSGPLCILQGPIRTLHLLGASRIPPGWLGLPCAPGFLPELQSYWTALSIYIFATPTDYFLALSGHTQTRNSRNVCLWGTVFPAFCSKATMSNQRGCRLDEALHKGPSGLSVNKGRWQDWSCLAPPDGHAFRKCRETLPKENKMSQPWAQRKIWRAEK